MRNLIVELTAGCPREDCSIAYDGSSTTLAAFLQTYDKHGNPQGRDPNTTTSHYSCLQCGRRWKIASRAGQDDVIEVVRVETKDAPDAQAKPAD